MAKCRFCNVWVGEPPDGILLTEPEPEKKPIVKLSPWMGIICGQINNQLAAEREMLHRVEDPKGAYNVARKYGETLRVAQDAAAQADAELDEMRAMMDAAAEL